MTYKLTELIVASGQATPGRILADGKVSGLTAGTSISAYKYGGGVTLSGEPAAYDPGIFGPTYASGQTFSVVVSFPNAGSKWPQIRQSQAIRWTNIGSLGNNAPNVNSVTWDDGAKTATLNYTVLGNFDPNTFQTLSTFTAWYQGYTSPSRPADGDTAGYTVRVSPVVTGGGAASGYDEFTSQWRFANPDAGGFNPTLFSNSVSGIRVNKRSYGAWTSSYDYEAHTSDSYNELAPRLTSYQNTTYTWWIRYRLNAASNGGTPGAWTNWGSLSWADPRPDV